MSVRHSSGAWSTSARAAFHAGARPNRSAVRTTRPAANANTRRSMLTTVPTGNSIGFATRKACTPPTASSVPSTAPATASSRPSVSSCRSSRMRPEPRAARTANSRCRVDERPSSRLATFTQAISRTTLTARNSTISVSRRFRPASHVNSCCSVVEPTGQSCAGASRRCRRGRAAHSARPARPRG